MANIALKKVARNNKGVLADLAGRSRPTIQSFFMGKQIGPKSFKAICQALQIDWQVTAGLSEADKDPEIRAIDALVREVRQQIEPLVREKCGQLRALNAKRPVGLGEIDTQVNIRERISERRGLALSELMGETYPEQLVQFGLAQVQERRVPAQEAVEEHSKVMILGKPGSGKTTFLKHLAIECISSWFQAKRVPLFLFLKDFARAEGQPDLLTYISQNLLQSEQLEKVLAPGRGLILLDGLDEVNEANSSRVAEQIRNLCQQFPENKFVITCRVAEREYTFDQFVEMEIAGFDEEKMAAFSNNLLVSKDDPRRAKRFLDKISKEPPIGELARNLLPMSLLCLVFEASGRLPRNRAELYDNGAGLLLKKWDADKSDTKGDLEGDMEGDRLYRHLYLKRKENLLGQIARITFETDSYFFQQQELEGYIKQYIQNLPGASTDPETLALDSAAVLKSLEAQHGLLEERGQKSYFFLHRSFHEYFTARKIVASSNPYAKDDSTLQGLVEHLTEKRWREVFLLSAWMLDSADVLLLLMKDRIDGLLAGDEKLQEFLSWVKQKSLAVRVPYQPAAVRAFYFGLDLAEDLYRNFALAFALDPDLSLDLDLNFDLDLALVARFDRKNGKLAAALQLYGDIDLAAAQDSYPELSRELQELQAELPNLEGEEEELQQWWNNKGEAWSEQLKAVAGKHRNVGRDWQFDKEQRELLKQYYYANKLLVDCLHSDCYVSRQVRQEIEESLLLPAG